ncbi:assimilatory sulfite reductase (NADPH) flavoprotein subunit [Neopusillimonas maritima]|uniref:Assimilatory sulfite reductase (NADPH) flavoprotein subunit n=2 Tax=Neopusillimonas maritima TaxID=2026239 RepID=A0ABX9N1Q1_9BURK|nr:assimilatory sulfite reductase (NADPH) flavoprotein subunit [Neopusillimonas maritima]
MLSTSLLSTAQRSQVDDLTTELDPNALTWLSGYFAGIAQERDRQGHARLEGNGNAVETAGAAVVAPLIASAVAQPEPQTSLTVTVLYGSQTGNAQRQAEQLAADLQTAGFAVNLVRADQYNVRDLKNERLLYVVISTQGDGDPPDDSMGFVEFLSGRRAPKLPELQYAVLGLGDSSYPEFCGIAKTLDARFAELGAQRLQAVGTADLDIETVSDPWRESAVTHAREQAGNDLAPNERPTGATVTPLHPVPRTLAYSRNHPFQAELLLNQPIIGRGSVKDIRHIELSLEGSGLHYEPGDALGIWPKQDPALVQAVLQATGLKGEETVTFGGDTRSVYDWLRQHRELTVLTRPFLEAHAARVVENGTSPRKPRARIQQSTPEGLGLSTLLAPENSADLRAWLTSNQLLDVLQQFPAQWTAQDFIQALRPLTPRLYSIASAQSVVDEEVHLTVANIAYDTNGEPRWGVTTRFLSQLEEGESVPLFIEKNERFRLPADSQRDIIMIGPGTGVAPFRAFVQARTEAGAAGRNWLFFGNPHFQTDFLYQTEWQQAVAKGELHRLDLAFSRDQAQRIYVQDRLREHAADVYDWIENGAHVYVCGDATRMAKDVHQTLLDIAREQGGRTQEQASEWLNNLAAQGRYARDVY